MAKLKIKTGDTVRVLAGDHRGEEGRACQSDGRFLGLRYNDGGDGGTHARVSTGRTPSGTVPRG